MFRHLDHDVIGGGAGIVVVAGQALQTARAAGQDFSRHRRISSRYHRPPSPGWRACIGALLHLDCLRKRTVSKCRAARRPACRLAAAAVVERDFCPISASTTFIGACVLIGVWQGVVVHVAGAGDAFEFDALFEQVFVDVEQAAARGRSCRTGTSATDPCRCRSSRSPSLMSR